MTFYIQMLEKTKVDRLDTLTETQDRYCACNLSIKYMFGCRIIDISNKMVHLPSWLERLLTIRMLQV